MVPAPLFLAHFASDRSHMRDAGGGWLQPPPFWPPIVGQAAAAEAAAGSTGGCRRGDVHANTLPYYLAFPAMDTADAALAAAAGGGSLAAGCQQHAAMPREEPAWLGQVLSEGAFLEAFGAR